MPEDEKDFSEYLTHTRGAMNEYSLLCGFLFSTITLLVANYASFDPFMIQVVLFILLAIFDLFLYNIMDLMVLGIYLVRRVPSFTKP